MKKCLTVLLCLLIVLTAVSAASAEGKMLVRAGGSFGMALAEDGSIWGWGDNARGQLGNGSNKRVYMPAPAGAGLDGTHVADIQCGNVATLFLMDDGTVYTCGSNNYGQQGFEGAKNYVFTPTQIPSLKNITQIACGFGQCLALDADGRVWAWGRNSNGQIGNGSRKSQQTPVLLPMEHIVSVKCGGKFCMALAEDGTIWGWGDNEWGQLVDASKWKNVLEPTQLSISGRFTQIACGGDIACGIDPDGTLWAWGRNDYWQLGVKNINKRTQEPVRVGLPEGTVVVRVLAYNSHTAAVTDEGALWQWGGVFHGQVGNGNRPWRDVPVEACPAHGVLDTDVGSLQSYVLLEDGTVMGCGCNEYGQTGAFRRMKYYVSDWMNTGLNLKTATWEDPHND